MLSIDIITDSKEIILKGLTKRGFKNLKVIDELIELNNFRKKTQQELDNTLFESNKISKEIAEIFKSGLSKNVDSLKENSASLKSASKKLSEQLEEIKSSIHELITTIPNIPDTDVP